MSDGAFSLMATQAYGRIHKMIFLRSRKKSVSSILIPLIMSSMEKIDIISNVMELRCFGKNKKRTWYMERRFTPLDIFCMVGCGVLVVVAVVLNYYNGGRFYNPFV